MNQIERLVVFSIFMENGEGIAVKAPDYIREKWQLVNADVSDRYIIAGLDHINQAKYKKWLKLWGLPLVKED